MHIPFCIHKCSYCDFYSFTKFSTTDFEQYTQQLCREIEQITEHVKKETTLTSLTSIFFGGGTPSLLPTLYLEKIFSELQKKFSWLEDIEITLEANPETVTDELLTSYKNLPINRISLGAQSFSKKRLDNLERLATVESIKKAAERLHKNGFENFNLDLIFGIADQTLEEILNDLQEVKELNPKHISFYNLTLKPGHKLYSMLPSSDDSAHFYEKGIQALEESGYLQYEISNFSKPDFESKHNLLYWDGDDFLGFGVSAASRFFWQNVFSHKKNLSDYKKYLETENFIPVFEKLTPFQTALEASFLELRKNKGISLEDFHKKYQYDLQKAKKYNLFLKESLLIERSGQLSLTPRGRLLADGVTNELVDSDFF